MSYTNVDFVYLSELDLANLGQLYRDERLKQKAETMKLDHCEKLRRFAGRQRGNWKWTSIFCQTTWSYPDIKGFSVSD